ncbi:MAG: 50S ribosomal protein L32e [Candidatus Aenigmatarchaeota archaeon]
MVNPRKKPKFLKQGINYLKRIRVRWRRPRGRDSKLRKKEKSKGKIPNPGYGAPKEMRGLHPSGFEEVYVQNLRDLEKIDPKKQVGRLSSTLGKKKREMIIKEAKERNIRLLNA